MNKFPHFKVRNELLESPKRYRYSKRYAYRGGKMVDITNEGEVTVDTLIGPAAPRIAPVSLEEWIGGLKKDSEKKP